MTPGRESDHHFDRPGRILLRLGLRQNYEEIRPRGDANQHPREGTDLLVVVNDENRTMIHFDVLQDVVAASRAMEAPATSKGLDC